MFKTLHWLAVMGCSFAVISCGGAKEQSSTDSTDKFAAQQDFDLAGGSVVTVKDSLTKSIVSVQAVFAGSSFICTGTLIARDWVLTAGHCVSNPTNGRLLPSSNLRVRFNETNVQQNVGIAGIGVTKVIRHPNYSLVQGRQGLTRIMDDIALIQLNRVIAAARPVYLCDRPTERLERRPYSEFNVGASGELLDLVGYGVSVANNTRTAGILRKGRGAYDGVVELFGSKFIKGFARENATAKLLSGDSGGAVFFPTELSSGRLIVAGVSSFINPNSGEFYAEPVGEHQEWIQDIVRETQFANPTPLPPPAGGICQVRAYGRYDDREVLNSDNGKRFYVLDLDKGVSNTSGVALIGNTKGLAIVKVPLANAVNLGTSCYCFNGLKRADPTDPSVTLWPVASTVTSCGESR